MSIIATSSGGSNFEVIEAGAYAARCFQMIHIGTLDTEWQGQKKTSNKVRLTWELPTEMKVWKEGEDAKPHVISKEYTLSLSDKANLRSDLKSWRGKDFTEEEAKRFDVTVLIGVKCLLNIIHTKSKDGTKTYADIGSISPLPKGMECPDQVNESVILSYDNWNQELFDSLHDYLKDKIKTSYEYKAMLETAVPEIAEGAEVADKDLPF